MKKIADFSPLHGQYINEVEDFDYKEIIKSNVATLYFKEPVVDEEFIAKIKKILDRKRPFLIYIESIDNAIIKEQLSKHPKKNMISYIYDFMNMDKSGKLTIYDFIRVDLEGNEKYWDKLLKFSKEVPCVYLISNAPDLSKLRDIPSNYRFEYETSK